VLRLKIKELYNKFPYYILVKKNKFINKEEYDLDKKTNELLVEVSKIKTHTLIIHHEPLQEEYRRELLDLKNNKDI
jgi:hypothetical protein